MVSLGLTDRLSRDSTLAEELKEDSLVEMANLTSEQTGVEGTIFVATAMGQHGPHVKYYVKPGRNEPSFSVSIVAPPAIPEVVANSLPGRVRNRMAPKVVTWVRLNATALLDFWYHGDTWTQPQVSAFFQGESLKKL
jgi:hypothetical protein